MARRWVKIRKPWIAVHCDGITHGRMTPVRVVLHDTESHSIPGLSDIEGIYNFWKDQGKGYGAHFVVDRTGTIGQGAPMRSEMWHTGNFNNGSVGIEQIGFASYTKLIWSKAHRDQLRSVAKLLAWLHISFDIPLHVPANIWDSGVVTHRMVSASGIDPSGHTDPGAGYPLLFVLWLARRFVKKGGWYVTTN